MTEMRMAELARRAGLGVPTIKFYIREGLLPRGRALGATHSVYTDAHLERLRLIVAMSRSAGLPLQSVREVVAALDSESSALGAMAATQRAILGEVDTSDATDADQATLDAIAERRGWSYVKDSSAHRSALAALAAIRIEDLEPVRAGLDDYAVAADAIGRADIETLGALESLDATAHAVVMGSVLKERLVDAFVALAEQHHAIRIANGASPPS